ncbi:MAG: DUF1289 domain-containing protein [Gammaproteobacteria bacterium]|nr:DUF1289 domain-containing protein [Gammaproteobacteria bacterium]MDH4253348.1 DUF1289 domain-containing protein [Gammaproteobacteria bacterium]MDH5310122.1 DUF1289 domain-containing protein [Gammaproteobacteria bacterium]
MTAAATARSEYPASPCVRICALDEQNVCTGCRRTLAEIANWARMSADERWRVLADLPARSE